MKEMHVFTLAPQTKEDVKVTLIYQGMMPAIKLFIHHTGARLDQAKHAVDKIAQEIEPGPA